MRSTFFILAGLLALCTGQGPVSKDAYIPSTGYIDTVKGVIIQNSLPKGGGYMDPAGKTFGYGIFWTRVINESATPLELKINFPADSFPILPSSYVKLFLLPATMTAGNENLVDYGASGLRSFLDTGLKKPTMLQRTISPKDESVFYIGALFYPPADGAVRAGLVLKEQDLFYSISIIGKLDPVLIPCGHINFKK